MFTRFWFVVLVLAANIASAQVGLYAKLDFGHVKLKKNFAYKEDSDSCTDKSSLANSMMFGSELGYQVNEKFSIGIALQYSKNKFNASCMDNLPLTVTTVNDDNYPIRVYCRPASSSTIRIKTKALLTNFYYKFEEFYNLKPYMVLGAGVARHKYGSSSVNMNYMVREDITQRISGKAKTTFAWSIGGGAQLPISERLYLDASLRYFNYGKLKMENKRYIQDRLVNTNGRAQTKLRGYVFLVGIGVKF